MLHRILFWLIIGNVLTWLAVSQLGERGHLRVNFFDIGQGDAALIETPTGQRILIDGGPSLAILRRLGEASPFALRSLDLVIATHPDADHIIGLPDVLTRYPVGALIISPVRAPTGAGLALTEVAHARGTPIITGVAGLNIKLTAGVTAKIISPTYSARAIGDDNDASVVVRLSYGSTDFLFMGDVSTKIERALLTREALLEAEVLKVGHHGSRTSSDQNFLITVDPEVAIISAGADNRYGHPHAEVLKNLTNSGTAIWRTDQAGTITVKSDGERFSVESASVLSRKHKP